MVSTAQRIQEVARRHRVEERRRLRETAHWTVAGNVVDESRRCPRMCRGTERRCKNAIVCGLDTCLQHGGGRFTAQVKAVRSLLEEAVTAHLRWLGHDV